MQGKFGAGTTTRLRRCKASAWQVKPGATSEPTVRTGRGRDTTYVYLQQMKDHLWRELWPAMPEDARSWWH